MSDNVYEILGRPAIADWGEYLTCYTAAAGQWASHEQLRWWRPLLEDGPVLDVVPDGDLFLFQHHARPITKALGLSLEASDSWDRAWEGIRAELRAQGRVIIAGDTWHLPWLPSHGTSHAPHWFTLTSEDDGLIVSDPLSMVNEVGKHVPVRVRVEESALADLSRALPPESHVYRLREQAALGTDEIAWGRPYRWLSRDGSLAQEDGATAVPGRDTTAASLRLLAARFRESPGDSPLYLQTDDLWQALRIRELALGAARTDGGTHPQVVNRWSRQIPVWRKLPPHLLYGKLQSESGRAHRASNAVADLLEELAVLELDEVRGAG